MTGSGDTDLLTEIQEEARQQRASGRHAASLDRDLEWAFERVVRNRPGEDRLTHSLWSVSAAAHITADAGLGETAHPAKRFAKRVLAKLIRWYILRITSQVTHFAEATSTSLRLLSDRVEALAEEVASVGPAPFPAKLEIERRRHETADSPLERSTELTEAALAALKAVGGRVLHADCRDGWLVARLTAAGVDAYGVDPSGRLLAEPAGPGLDLVQGDVLDHLRKAPFQSLSGVVLSGCVDRMTAADARRLSFLLRARLAPGGVVIIAGTNPATWAAEASPVERDLATGRPLHAETWRHLLAEQGIGDDGGNLSGGGASEIVLGPESAALPGTPASYLVTATRAR